MLLRNTFKHPYVVIFVVALVVRLGLFYIVASHYQFDGQKISDHVAADGYYQIAHNLYQHRLFSIDDRSPQTPDSFRTPGYPGLLWLSLVMSGSAVPIIFLQIIIASLLPVLIGKIAERVGVSLVPKIVIMLLLAIDPLGLSLSVKLLTEVFFTGFFLLGVERVMAFITKIEAASCSPKWYRHPLVWAGWWFGVATLFRPTTLYFTGAMTVIWIVYRLIRRVEVGWLAVGLFFVLSLGPVVPWMVRNYQVFGVFSYSSAKEHVAYATLAPSILMVAEGRSYNDVQRDWFTKDGFSELPSPTVANAAWFKQRVAMVIKQHPTAFARVAVISVVTFFTHDGALDLVQLVRPEQQLNGFPSVSTIVHLPLSAQMDLAWTLLASPLAPVIIARGLWLVVALAFVSAVLYLIITRRVTLPVVFCLLTIAYFSATTLTNGVAVNARFRFPVDGLVLIIIACGVLARFGRRGA